MANKFSDFNDCDNNKINEIKKENE